MARSSTPRTRRRAPEDKRARILEAATALVVENGPDKMKMSEVARIAAVSEGIIFHHFGNKRGLLMAIATSHGHEVAKVMFEGILPGERPDVERMIRRVFEHAREHGKLEDMLVMSDDPTSANQTMQATREVIIAALSQAFVQWKAAGFITTKHPDIAASLLYGLVSYGIHECVSFNDGERVEAYIEEAVSCIEGALGYEGPEKKP